MRLASAALLALAAACGGSPIPPGGDACAVVPSLPSFGTGAGLAAVSVNRNRIIYQVPINNETAFDVLALDLFRGYTAFTQPDEIRTGTFTIGPEDAKYDTCGICIIIYANVDRTTFRETQTYMADSGTLTLTSVNGRVSGSMANVHFRHVNIDDTDPDGNGPGTPSFATTDGVPCFSTLGTLSFDTAFPTDAGVSLDAL